MKEEYKKGDWIVITKSNENWGPSMDDMVGKVVQLTRDGGESARFEGKGCYSWNARQGHFRKALSHEIPNAEPIVIDTYQIY